MGFLLATMGVLGASFVVCLVAYGSLGGPRLAEESWVWLDDHHVWGKRTALLRAAILYGRADADADARWAVAFGDVRLLPASGLGGFFPGLDDDRYLEYWKYYGAKDFLYGGCVVSSPEESSYRSAAFDYAATYNRTVVSLRYPSGA